MSSVFSCFSSLMFHHLFSFLFLKNAVSWPFFFPVWWMIDIPMCQNVRNSNQNFRL